MTNMKTTKRALLSSVLALMLCFAMLLGTTFAWFTDTAVSANNKIVAGTLDVELYHWTATDVSTNISDSHDPVFADKDVNGEEIYWEPGKTEVRYLSIKNNGNLALKYKVELVVTEVSEDSLLDVMTYAITPDAHYGDVDAWAGNGISVDEGSNATGSNNVTLLPGEEHFFALSVHMDEEAGNQYMNETVTFDIKVLAGQLAHEKDSFDETYDEPATYPYVAVSTVVDNTVVNTLDTGDIAKINLPIGVPTGDYAFKMSNKSIETDSTGSTTVSMDLTLEKDGVKVTDDGVTEYAVELDVGASKRVVSVTHNGVEVDDYTYDIATGILTIKTTSFSPFSYTVEDVREVTGLEGLGTEADPYLINDYFDLAWFRDNVNTYTQDGSNQYKGKYVKLTSDIDLNGVNWKPIGDNSNNDHEAFVGIFDGDGHTIYNLYINANEGNLGFFARTGSYNEAEKAVVKNLNFVNVDVSTDVTNHWTTGHGDNVGGVIANAGGNTIVENVNVSGEIYIEGCGYVGGIVGHGYPKMYNCHVEGDGEFSYIMCGYWCGAGMIGYAGENGTVLDGCSVKGIYIFSQSGASGAIAGLLNAGNTVTNCYAENVEIELNSAYACGYACGNGEESTYNNVSVKNVSVKYKGTELKDIPVDGSGYHNCDNDALIYID